MASIKKRLRRDGGVSWGVRVKVKRYPLFSKTFPTKFEAEQWAWRTEAAARGKFPRVLEIPFFLLNIFNGRRAEVAVLTVKVGRSTHAKSNI